MFFLVGLLYTYYILRFCYFLFLIKFCLYSNLLFKKREGFYENKCSGSSDLLIFSMRLEKKYECYKLIPDSTIVLNQTMLDFLFGYLCGLVLAAVPDSQ